MTSLTLSDELAYIGVSTVAHHKGTVKGIYHEYAGRLEDFCTDVLRVELTSQQIEVGQHVLDNRVTNCPAGHGVGKSHLSACLALYWMLVLNGRVVTTAPTNRQVVTVLWAQIATLHAAANLPGEMTQKRLTISAFAWGFGFTGSKNNSTSVQGIHYENLLAIEDEANGIDPSIDEAFTSLCSSSKNRFFRVGNPTTPYTAFHQACNQEGRIQLNCMEHDNVKEHYELLPGNQYATLKPNVRAAIEDEKGNIKPDHLWPDWVTRPKIPGAVDISFIERWRKHGENSANWKSRVVGEFPISATFALFYDSLLTQSLRPSFVLPENADITLGVDVGGGSDPHAISAWYGNICFELLQIKTVGDFKDGKRLLNFIKQHYKQQKIRMIFLDADGIGNNLVNQFLEGGLPVKGIQWNSKAKNKSCFNLRAQHYLDLSRGFTNLSLKEDREELGVFIVDLPIEAREELLVIEHLEETTSGKLQIKKKDEIKSKLGRSPNLADCLALGFASTKSGLSWLSATDDKTDWLQALIS